MKFETAAFNQSIVSLAFAEDIKPSWINNPPKDDTQHMYGMGMSFGHDLEHTIQNAKNIARQQIGEKVLNNVRDTLKQPPLSIDKTDNLPLLVGKNVEKESTFKEVFVKKNEGYEAFVLGIYPRASERLAEWSVLLEARALAEDEKRFQLDVSKIQNLRNLAEAARKAKKSMKEQLDQGG